MHRIVEEISNHFPIMYPLISRINQVFLKAPSFTTIIKTEASEILLLPKIMLKCWET